MDTRRLARYPFLKESAAYTKDRGISLQDIIQDIAYKRSRDLGRDRVLEALNHGEIGERPLLEAEDQLRELLSYPMSRILVSCIADPYLTRRYALAEAVSAARRLRSEDAAFVEKLAGELEVDITLTKDAFRMHFLDFLKLTNQMRHRSWKLINQRVESGFVHLSRDRAIRVLQNAIQKRVEAGLPLPVNDDILKAFTSEIVHIKKLIEEKKARYKAEDLGRVRITRFPPCMYQLLAMIQAGENVPHTGRFAIVSFLHNIGLTNDEIFNLFSTVPDFDLSKTRYQIEHITGKISATEYTPPECSTMKSYGLCPGGDDLCHEPWMNHPLAYYRSKARWEREKSPIRAKPRDKARPSPPE